MSKQKPSRKSGCGAWKPKLITEQTNMSAPGLCAVLISAPGQVETVDEDTVTVVTNDVI